MTIADRIKQLRQKRQWTQDELAEKIGIKQKQISTYERGVNSPSTDFPIKIADAFGVTLEFLVFAVKGETTGDIH